MVARGLVVGVLLLAATAAHARSLSTADTPCACTLSYMPVCDADGNEIAANEDCAVRCEGADPADLYPCPAEQPVTLPAQPQVDPEPLPETPCACTLSYMPVCDADGNEIAANEDCAVRCEGADPADLHPCPAPDASKPQVQAMGDETTDEAEEVQPETLPEEAKPEVLPQEVDTPCACTLELDPVCDVHGNEVAPNANCAVRCKGADPAALHPCNPDSKKEQPAREPKPVCVCTMEYMPVCDAQGIIIAPSACSAHCAGYTVDQMRACKPQEPANEPKDACKCTKGVFGMRRSLQEFMPQCDWQGFVVGANKCTAECNGYAEGQFKDCKSS